MKSLTEALQLAQCQMRVIDDAWWRVWDALCLVRRLQPDQALSMHLVFDDLGIIEKKLTRLKRALKRQVDICRQRIDAHAVEGITRSPEGVADLRARLSQTDLHMTELYKRVIQLGRQCAKPLAKEIGVCESGTPTRIYEATVCIELYYLPDGGLLTGEDSRASVLAHQEAFFYWVSAQEEGDNAIGEDPGNDNWIDFFHPWMSRRCWLTHDVLENNHGRNPRFGLMALLNTGTVRVRLHTVRSLEYDLHAGQFVKP